MDSPSLLLELAASDDLPAFKRAVEAAAVPPNAAAPWYCRSLGVRRTDLHHRTPLHIAALYGSTAVLTYLVSALPPSDINLPCGSDAATPLHCAAASGSASSLAAVKILLAASADVDALDAFGNRPADLIPRHSADSGSLRSLLKATYPRPPSPETKIKEYPLDLTLPDIKSGVYGSDEFRMYTFKVKPCSRAYSHDWTECPFVHPGENARRRDPRKFLYSCVPCPEFRKGSCRNGDNCEYAHGVFESWLHPAQYRTRLCKDETGCNRRVCFFAHKQEELRLVNPTAASVAGLGMPSSPRSSSFGMSNLDMAAALMMMQPGSPMSPSSSSGMVSSWMNQGGSVSSPNLQFPSSRLKTSLTARDLELDHELLGLASPRSNMRVNSSDYSDMMASPRSNLRVNSSDYSNMIASAHSNLRVNSSDYSDLLGSLDRSMISQLQGLSLRQTAAATAAAQYQTMSQNLLSEYGGALPASSAMNVSSSLGLDHSTVKAIMNSRSSAFAKRSQSFIDRGAVGRSPSTIATSPTPDWGSPNGKLDWGVQGEELNKLRKSASFGFRSNNAGGFGGLASPRPSQVLNEPDLSWVHSLVKDGPATVPVNQQQTQQYQFSVGRDSLAPEMVAPWSDQLFTEQEQMVACRI